MRVYERKNIRLRIPKAKQYTAKGLSVLVLKYRVKKITDRYDPTAAHRAPTSAVWISLTSLEANNIGNLIAAAAAMIGVAKRKENRSASS